MVHDSKIMEERYCIICERFTLQEWDIKWAKFCLLGCGEELVEVYTCEKCGEEEYVRH